MPFFTGAKTCATGTPYTVVKGDYLDSIATSHGTTLDAIKAANPDIKNPDQIEVGQVVCLPGMLKIPSI